MFRYSFLSIINLFILPIFFLRSNFYFLFYSILFRHISVHICMLRILTNFLIRNALCRWNYEKKIVGLFIITPHIIFGYRLIFWREKLTRKKRNQQVIITFTINFIIFLLCCFFIVYYFRYYLFALMLFYWYSISLISMVFSYFLLLLTILWYFIILWF